MTTFITANQYPEKRNRFRRLVRNVCSSAPILGLVQRPARPQGISIIARVRDEIDWIKPSVESIESIADEIVIVDNGSSDGTYEMLEKMASLERDKIRLWREPDLRQCELSNSALSRTRFRWVFRWDGDMVAHTSGDHDIAHLRERILSLDSRRYYLIYLRHVNLAGDLSHQDPEEMAHIEEYAHTFSNKARFIHPGRFEAVRFPEYFRPLFWYETYACHVNVKPAQRMLLRYFWEDWMELKDYTKYPKLKDYVQDRIENEFGTNSMNEAKDIYMRRACNNFIRYDADLLGPYPDLLKPYLDNPKYELRYEHGRITGRDEN